MCSGNICCNFLTAYKFLISFKLCSAPKLQSMLRYQLQHTTLSNDLYPKTLLNLGFFIISLYFKNSQRIRQHQKFWPALILPPAAVITHYLGTPAYSPLFAHRFPNKLAHNVPNTMLKNPLFCSLALLLIVLLTSYINKAES